MKSLKKAKKIDLKALVKFIRGAKNILIATHESPDGDGLGSIVALGNALRQLKKNVTLYCKDPVPKMYHFLPEQNKILTSIPKNKKF